MFLKMSKRKISNKFFCKQQLALFDDLVYDSDFYENLTFTPYLVKRGSYFKVLKFEKFYKVKNNFLRVDFKYCSKFGMFNLFKVFKLNYAYKYVSNMCNTGATICLCTR